jgi:hypothetical protein
MFARMRPDRRPQAPDLARRLIAGGLAAPRVHFEAERIPEATL